MSLEIVKENVKDLLSMVIRNMNKTLTNSQNESINQIQKKVLSMS